MSKSVLIIDDDKMLRDALASGLTKAGFDVITASDAEYAFNILKRISVDAIVLDRMMDGMDGLTFLKKLRNYGNTIPVIMLTALSGPENAIDGLSNGANDYMAKPFKLQELILRLNNIIKTRQPISSESISNLTFTENDFFITTETGQKKLLSLSNEEKKLLYNLVNPVGNIVPATPMVAKRLRNKINVVLSDIDIITIRGMGYKIIKNKQ